MKNKRVKRMIIDAMKKKHDMDFWFDGKDLMYYEAPHWTFEGDEYVWMFFETISVTSAELKGWT